MSKRELSQRETGSERVVIAKQHLEEGRERKNRQHRKKRKKQAPQCPSSGPGHGKTRDTAADVQHENQILACTPTQRTLIRRQAPFSAVSAATLSAVFLALRGGARIMGIKGR